MWIPCCNNSLRAIIRIQRGPGIGKSIQNRMQIMHRCDKIECKNAVVIARWLAEAMFIAQLFPVGKALGIGYCDIDSLRFKKHGCIKISAKFKLESFTDGRIPWNKQNIGFMVKYPWVRREVSKRTLLVQPRITARCTYIDWNFSEFFQMLIPSYHEGARDLTNFVIHYQQA